MTFLSDLGEEVWSGTHQGDVEEVLILLDLGERGGDVGVEVIPSQAKLLRCHCCWGEEEWKVASEEERVLPVGSPLGEEGFSCGCSSWVAA